MSQARYIRGRRDIRPKFSHRPRCAQLRGAGEAPLIAARVLFPFVGDTVGGSHRSAMLLIQGLDTARHYPLVILHRDGPLRAALAEAGIDAQLASALPVFDPMRRGRLGAVAALLCGLPRLVRFLRVERIDIVHCNDSRMTVTWALAARLAGCGLVVHQRTRHVRSRVPTLAAAMAHRLVCISRFVADTLPPRLQARAAVIANPFDVAAPVPERAAARARLGQELGIPPEERIVAFLGTLQDQKRPGVFVEAAARMRRAGVMPLAFVMAGRADDTWSDKIRRVATTHGLDSGLHLLGFRADIAGILAASDVVLAPAVAEGYGRVLVEAALCGTPVVAARSGGHEEAVLHGHTGLLVAPDDPGALADAALTLMGDPERGARMVAAARRRAEEEFTPARHAARIAAVYDSVQARKAPVRADEIAFVIEGLGGGGAQHVLTTLANAWAAKGRRVAVITFSAETAEGLVLDPHVRHVVVGGRGESASLLAAAAANLRRILRLRRALRRSRAPVVVPFIGATNVLTVLAAAGLRRRVIVCERNDPARQKLGAPWDRMRRWVYPRAALVTANSRSALETLAGFVPRERLRLLPNPLRTPHGDATIPVDGPVILSVGRLHPQKGHDVLLAAFAAARDALCGWRLVILGEGPERAALKEQALCLGIADTVDIPGQVADPFPWYRAADMFVLASRYEGTPNALLEAMSCGIVPVVTDAQPGALDLVQNGVSGLVVGADDADGLAAALRLLAGNRALRDRLGAVARGRVAPFEPAAAIAAWERAVFGDAAP